MLLYRLFRKIAPESPKSFSAVLNTLRESIHAVEAAVQKIAPEVPKSLSAALNTLEKREMFKHPAQHETYRKLYGYNYTNNEDADVGFRRSHFYVWCVRVIC